jgi:hypothetical protein
MLEAKVTIKCNGCGIEYYQYIPFTLPKKLDKCHGCNKQMRRTVVAITFEYRGK